MRCLGKLIDKEEYIDEYVKNEMIWAEKCHLIVSHLAAISRFFNNLGSEIHPDVYYVVNMLRLVQS